MRELLRNTSTSPLEVAKVLYSKPMESDLEQQAALQSAMISARELVLRQFLHDVRSPFQGLTGFTHLLQADWREMDGEEVDDCLEQLSTAAAQVLATIDEFSQIVRENRQLVWCHPVAIPWDAAWRQATGRLWGRFHEQGIKVIDVPVNADLPLIFVDAALTRGVFELLFINALPRLQADDEIRIEASASDASMVLRFGPLPLSASEAHEQPLEKPTDSAPTAQSLAEAQILLAAFGGTVQQDGDMVVMELPLAS